MFHPSKGDPTLFIICIIFFMSILMVSASVDPEKSMDRSVAPVSMSEESGAVQAASSTERDTMQIDAVYPKIEPTPTLSPQSLTPTQPPLQATPTTSPTPTPTTPQGPSIPTPTPTIPLVS